MTDLTPADVAKLAEAATPGPWKVEFWPRDDKFDYLKISSGEREVVGGCGCCGSPGGDNFADVAFVAAAHDMADLIARMDEVIKAADALEAEAIAAHDELALWFESANSLEEHGFDMGDTERAMNALARTLTAFAKAREKLK